MYKHHVLYFWVLWIQNHETIYRWSLNNINANLNEVSMHYEHSKKSEVFSWDKVKTSSFRFKKMNWPFLFPNSLMFCPIDGGILILNQSFIIYWIFYYRFINIICIEQNKMFITKFLRRKFNTFLAQLYSLCQMPVANIQENIWIKRKVIL